MGLKKEDLSGPPPVPNNVYFLQVSGFRPKIAKSGESLNYNGEFTIVQNPQYDGRKVFHPLNTAFAIAIWDFVHACGCEMETITVPISADEDQHEESVLPGIFEGAADNPDNPEKWGKYMGPLTNKIFKAELTTTTYQGKQKNEIRMFFCALPGCATKYPDVKHSTNLVKSS